MVQTTMGYVKQAEDIAGDLGVAFGPLPDGLTDPPEGSGRSGQVLASQLNDSDTLECRRRESNPRPSAYETPALTN